MIRPNINIKYEGNEMRRKHNYPKQRKKRNTEYSKSYMLLQ